MVICQQITHSAQQTQQFAQQFAQTLHGGDVILLKGDLGAGKTHFAKGLAAGLGVDDTVTSPTFALHNSYQGRLTFNHFDFYRIDSSEEVELLGLDEFFYDRNAVCAIEWSERVADLLPQHAITVTIDKLDGDGRQITVERN